MSEADTLREQAEQAKTEGQQKADKLNEAADAQEKADAAKKDAVDGGDSGGGDSFF